MVLVSQSFANLALITMLLYNLDICNAESEGSHTLDYMVPVRPEKRSPEFEEPEPKVSGLLKRNKRFGCWHTCLGRPQPYVKQDRDHCEDGSPCHCLVDLLGKVHGISCTTMGRTPFLKNGQTPSTQIVDDELADRKLQCNYKTCWTIDEVAEAKKGNEKTKLIHNLASLIDGIYYKGKCSCGQKRMFSLDDIRPAALNHAHQREDYKFAMSFKTFPDSKGNCVCRFGKSLNEPAPGGVRSVSDSEESQSFSFETSGLRYVENMENFDIDQTRDIIQCSLRGCRHVLITVPKRSELPEGNNSTINGNSDETVSTPKSWYAWEMSRRRYWPEHEHDTATSLQCNLKTCWRVENGSTRKITLPHQSSSKNNDGDPLRDSIQLSLQERRKLLGQKISVKSRSRAGGINVQCIKGVCGLSESENSIKNNGSAGSGGKHKLIVSSNHLAEQEEEDEIRPGKDGLCPCHEAYRTYYNWKHKK